MIMKKNILVVDDSALMRRVICDIINSDDTFQVTDVCRDGLEAYEKLKVNRYDGVILDVNMPEMTGLELQEHLNQQGNTVPIIFLTSYGDIDMAVNALHSGAADFLQKPVKSEKLLASVEKAATASVTLAEPLRVMSQEEAKQKLSLITEREIQILKLTSLRLSSRAVGERLGISDRTVESHRASAGKKLQLHTKEEILQLIDLANGTVG